MNVTTRLAVLALAAVALSACAGVARTTPTDPPTATDAPTAVPTPSDPSAPHPSPAGPSTADPTVAPSSGTVPASLAEARAAWAAAAITDYRYQLAYQCFCLRETTEPRVVTVVEGQVADVTPTPPDTDVPFGTVEALHDFIATEQASSDSVSVTYDQNGVPLRAEFDRITNAIDDELAFELEWLPAG